MGIAKIVAEKILDIPHLQHLDYLIENKVASIQQGSMERGDMAGRDLLGNWHVIEAKGSSYPPQQAILKHAKTQAQRIERIEGIPPATANCCSSHFNINGTTVFLADPEGDESAIPNVEMSSTKFLTSYYNKVFGGLTRTESITSRTNIALLDELHPIYFNLTDAFAIGTIPQIVDNITDNRIDFVEQLKLLSPLLSEFKSELTSIGTDGIIVVDKRR